MLVAAFLHKYMMKYIRFRLQGLVLIALLSLAGCKGEQMCDVSDQEITECHSQQGYYWDYGTCQCEED